MMTAKRQIRLAAVGVLAVSWGVCGTIRAQQVELGPRYFDPLRGFSLRPPLGTERKRGGSLSRMVGWSKRDAKTGAIAWTLSVLQGKESKEITDLEVYSKALVENLRTQEKFRVDSTELISVDGKQAIDLRGVGGGKVLMWKRQVWILAEPDRFLILAIAGPVGIKNQMDRIHQGVLETVRLIDPESARKQREENLARGKEFLSGLTKDRIDKGIRSKPRWYLFQLKGKYVGFVRIAESRGSFQGDRGYEVRSWVLLRLPKVPQRLLKRVMFITPDLTVEHWSEHLRMGIGENAVRAGEEGIKQQDMILCNIAQGRRTKTQKRQVPVPIYLPRAIGMLLPRLVDLNRRTSYSFATYTTPANEYDLRTFTVLGPEEITLGGRKVKTIHVTDQVAADREAANLWLDEKGNLLRLEDPEGLVMEPVTHAAILSRFPEADKLVRSLGR
jgi:hypothetical protein